MKKEWDVFHVYMIPNVLDFVYTKCAGDSDIQWPQLHTVA